MLRLFNPRTDKQGCGVGIQISGSGYRHFEVFDSSFDIYKFLYPAPK